MGTCSDQDNYAAYRVSPTDPATLRHPDVRSLLPRIQAFRPAAMKQRELGQSVEGRAVSLVSIGSGPVNVLLWSQMHGDEPTHTAVLLDLCSFLQQNYQHAEAAAILRGCRLSMIPLLNPDGAERWTRENAEGIDVNRDALELASPEARMLSAAARQTEPQFAFNLHDHNPRATVQGSDQPAAVALMVPPLDAEDRQTDGTRRATHVAATVVEALRAHAPGMIARYVADYMPNAFGESLQQHGISTVLMEAGGWPTPDRSPVVRLHLVGLLAALTGIATFSYDRANPAWYEDLPPVVSAT